MAEREYLELWCRECRNLLCEFESRADALAFIAAYAAENVTDAIQHWILGIDTTGGVRVTILQGADLLAAITGGTS